MEELNRTWLTCKNKSHWFLQKLEHSCIKRKNKLHWFTCVNQACLSFIIFNALYVCVLISVYMRVN